MSSEDTPWVTTLAITYFAVLASVTFTVYAAEVMVPNYYVGLLQLYLVGGGMLLWLPSSSVGILSPFRFISISDGMRVDPVLAALTFHQASKVDGFLSFVSDHFLLYHVATGIIQDNRVGSIAALNGGKVANGLLVLQSALDVNFNWLPGVEHKSISEVEPYYTRYCDIIDGD